MDANTELKSTPLTPWHQSHGAKLVPFAGYSMPLQYEGLVKEHQAVRTQAGLFDVCHMGEIRVRGADAVAFVNFIVANDLQRIALGQAMYTCACLPNGGIVDDLIVYRHADDDLLIVCNASNREKFWQHLHKYSGNFSALQLTDESDATALIALQGPQALNILSTCEPALDAVKELRPFRFLSATLAGVSTTIARTGYTGEDGVEIFCAAEDALRLWEALIEAGQPVGLVPCGLGSRDTLRLEARLSLYGNDLDEETSPLEAGLAWTVKLDKADFLGKEALVSQQAGALKRRIVGFQVEGRGSARPGYPLLNAAGEVVGKCSSGGPSPSLGTAIGLGFLPLDMTEVGTEFFVDARGRKLPAKVVKTPFYRRG